jgi:site-specific recombinase XerD
VAIEALQDLLGHKRLTMTQVYGKPRRAVRFRPAQDADLI